MKQQNPFQIDRNRRNARNSLRLALGISLGFILTTSLASLLSDLIARTVEGWNTGHLLALLSAVFVALCFVLWWNIENIQRQIGANAIETDARDIDPVKYVICGYSYHPNVTSDEWRNDTRKAAEIAKLDEFSEQAKESGDPFYRSWQQNIRVLAALKGVEKVYVINPDRDQFAEFNTTMTRLFPSIEFELIKPENAKFEPNNKYDEQQLCFYPQKRNRIPADYEDFNYVTHAIEAGLAKICADTGKHMRDIESSTVIDITAGLKPFSVAGAIASLNRNLIFVYAKTNFDEADPGGVIAYNAHIQIVQNRLGI